ncbi:hypothetical protein [Sessilibacter sp. MAH2]
MKKLVFLVCLSAIFSSASSFAATTQNLETKNWFDLGIGSGPSTQVFCEGPPGSCPDQP